jgi:hypothetical protein
MKMDKIERKKIKKNTKQRPINKKGPQLKEKINRKTTLNFEGRREKSHCHRTAMNCTTCIVLLYALSLDALEDIGVGSFWPPRHAAHIFKRHRWCPLETRANHFFFCYHFYFLKELFALNSNRL